MTTKASRPHPIKRRMFELGVTNEQLAFRLGMDDGLVGRYLRGIRAMPDDFPPKCYAALDKFEEAAQAAAEAEARVWGEK